MTERGVMLQVVLGGGNGGATKSVRQITPDRVQDVTHVISVDNVPSDITDSGLCVLIERSGFLDQVTDFGGLYRLDYSELEA